MAAIDYAPETNYYSFGIHPWDIRRTDVELHLAMIEQLCSQKKIIAVGEIGIDKTIQTSLEIQQMVFENQIKIAKDYGYPVIIHCVKAWSEILSIRKSCKYINPWIFHGFNGSIQTARQIIKSGCYLSFGKALIENRKLHEIIVQLPKKSIFLETDDSDMKIEEVYQKAAEIYSISIKELIGIILENFKTVFRNDVPV
jgi:TatD DNase family protein